MTDNRGRNLVELAGRLRQRGVHYNCDLIAMFGTPPADVVCESNPRRGFVVCWSPSKARPGETRMRGVRGHWHANMDIAHGVEFVYSKDRKIRTHREWLQLAVERAMSWSGGAPMDESPFGGYVPEQVLVDAERWLGGVLKLPEDPFSRPMPLPTRRKLLGELRAQKILTSRALVTRFMADQFQFSCAPKGGKETPAYRAVVRHAGDRLWETVHHAASMSWAVEWARQATGLTEWAESPFGDWVPKVAMDEATEGLKQKFDGWPKWAVQARSAGWCPPHGWQPR